MGIANTWEEANKKGSSPKRVRCVGYRGQPNVARSPRTNTLPPCLHRRYKFWAIGVCVLTQRSATSSSPMSCHR